MSKYTEKDAAKDTGTSVKEVSSNWHKAKDDAAGEPGWKVPQDRHAKEKAGSRGKKRD